MLYCFKIGQSKNQQRLLIDCVFLFNTFDSSNLEQTSVKCKRISKHKFENWCTPTRSINYLRQIKFSRAWKFHFLGIDSDTWGFPKQLKERGGSLFILFTTTRCNSFICILHNTTDLGQEAADLFFTSRICEGPVCYWFNLQ